MPRKSTRHRTRPGPIFPYLPVCQTDGCMEAARGTIDGREACFACYSEAKRATAPAIWKQQRKAQRALNRNDKRQKG